MSVFFFRKTRQKKGRKFFFCVKFCFIPVKFWCVCESEESIRTRMSRDFHRLFSLKFHRKTQNILHTLFLAKNFSRFWKASDAEKEKEPTMPPEEKKRRRGVWKTTNFGISWVKIDEQNNNFQQFFKKFSQFDSRKIRAL